LKCPNSHQYLSFIGESGGVLFVLEEGVEEDLMDHRGNHGEVEVSGQVDQAETVGEAAVQFEASHPLKPRNKLTGNLKTFFNGATT
jgi:hypothetical protein